MTPVALRKGQNHPLIDDAGIPCSRIQVVLRWRDPGSRADVDISVLLLGNDGKVRSDDDFVFYNSPVGADGAVRLVGKTESEEGSEDRVSIDVEALPGSVSQIAIAASFAGDEGFGFGLLDGLSLTVLDVAGEVLFGYEIADASTETAFVFGELYLRAGQWKFRAVGQGWDAGLGGLASDYGIAIADPADETPPVDADTEHLTAGDEGKSESGDAEAGTVAREQLHDDPAEIVVTTTDVDAESAGVINPTTGMSPGTLDPEGVSADLAPVMEDMRTEEVSVVDARSTTGLRTKKPKPKPAAPPVLTLGHQTWQPARLFSIYGVGAQEEQEKRATSALLATMMSVREFGRTLVSRLGGPTGPIECYQEAPFKVGERTVIPDGVICVAGRGRRWTALLETKTGTNALRLDQVEAYVDVAVNRGYDAVVTLSNEIVIVGGDHPTPVDRKRLKKVALHHLSWSEVLHEARMQLAHRGVEDRYQAWILNELIRYLEHPKSGAAAFDDMGPSWVQVREAVRSGTLRPNNPKLVDVVRSWDRLTGHLAMRLTSDLGVPASVVVSRALAADAPARLKSEVDTVLREGILQVQLRIHRAAGVLTVKADLKANKVQVRVDIDAPREGGAARRVNWLVRQLKTAPDDVFVEVLCTKKDQAANALLKSVREDSAPLIPEGAVDVRSFRLTKTFPMGPKRNGAQGGFVTSVEAAVDRFYFDVVQGVKPWVKPAAKLPEEIAEEAAETISELDRAAAAEAVG